MFFLSIFFTNGPFRCNLANYYTQLDCPQFGPGPVWPLFVDPGPRPGLVLDLDLGPVLDTS